MAIQKLNNIVYSRLNNPWSSVISDQWKHDTTQDWEYLAKYLDGVSTKLIEDKALLRLNIYILATGYLEERAPHFTEVTGNDEETNEDGGEVETVSNSEKKTKKKALRKEKRDAQALLLAVARLSASTVLVPGLSAPPSATTSGVSMPMPRSSTLSSVLSVSGLSVPVPRSSALPSVWSVAGVFVPMPALSAPPSVSFMSGVSVPMLGLSASPGLSSPPFSTWSSLQIPTLVPRRQRLSQWSRIIKKVSSEETPPTFALPSKRLSPLFFPSSGIGKKRPFDKAFNINCRPLADNHAGEDVNLSFAECQCSPAVKANRP